LLSTANCPDAVKNLPSRFSQPFSVPKNCDNPVSGRLPPPKICHRNRTSSPNFPHLFFFMAPLYTSLAGVGGGSLLLRCFCFLLAFLEGTFLFVPSKRTHLVRAVQTVSWKSRFFPQSGFIHNFFPQPSSFLTSSTATVLGSMRLGSHLRYAKGNLFLYFLCCASETNPALEIHLFLPISSSGSLSLLFTSHASFALTFSLPFSCCQPLLPH